MASGSLHLVSTFGSRARLVDGVIMTLEAKEDHFVVDAQSLLESLADLDDRLLRFGFAEPHRDLVSPIPDVDDRAVHENAFAVE